MVAVASISDAIRYTIENAPPGYVDRRSRRRHQLDSSHGQIGAHHMTVVACDSNGGEARGADAVRGQ